MARQITKELAEKIVKKLGATKSLPQRKGAPHELFDFVHDGVLVAKLSLRRGSEKDQGHDHMLKELRLGPRDAREFAQCKISVAEYLEILRGKGLL